jgi:hypothetical protein
MKFKLLYVFLFLLTSCSSHTDYNRTVQGDLTITGGVAGSKKWGSDLEFKRSSWFAGLTKQFEVLIAEVPKNSDFYNWFSESEQRMLNSCSRVLVTATTGDRRQIFNFGNLRDQIEESAYKTVYVPDFKRHLLAHPVFVMWKLNRHRITAFCKNGLLSLKTPINISVPGFNTIAIF